MPNAAPSETRFRITALSGEHERPERPRQQDERQQQHEARAGTGSCRRRRRRSRGRPRRRSRRAVACVPSSAAFRSVEIVWMARAEPSTDGNASTSALPSAPVRRRDGADDPVGTAAQLARRSSSGSPPSTSTSKRLDHAGRDAGVGERVAADDRSRRAGDVLQLRTRSGSAGRRRDEHGAIASAERGDGSGRP